MSFSCPACRNKIEAPQKEPTTYVVCPKCKKEFPFPEEHRKGVLKPGSRIGGYEIVGMIGSGGMGKVYEAIQLSLQRRVALKVIAAQMAGSDTMVKRFLLEVRSTASLEHPSIVTVFEASQEEGNLYLAMELVNGVTLEEILKDCNGPMDEKSVWKYAILVCNAMNYAWKYQQLLHRDIKPANIMVLRDGEIKICDLGIAKRPDDEFDLTKEGMAIGTPHYMSPEQGQGIMKLDFRADIYSLGATVYHLTTGRLPFQGTNAVTVITKHIMEDVIDPLEINNKLSRGGAELIKLMMAKKPEDRHPSWDALREDIERVLADERPHYRPGPVKPARAVEPPPSSTTAPRNGIGNKRTMVDMHAIDQELRLTELKKENASGGWSLVRASFLCLVLMAATYGVAYQYRNEILPEIFNPPEVEEVPQALQLDDGTSPAPPEVAENPDARIQIRRDRFYEETLAAIGRDGLNTSASIRNVSDSLTARNKSLIGFSRFCAAHHRLDIAIKLNRHILMTPRTHVSEELGVAFDDLVSYLDAVGDKEQLPTVFQKALQNTQFLTDSYAAGAYIRFAEFNWRMGRILTGQKLLQAGVGRLLQAKRGDAADLLAVALIRSIQAQNDPGRLYAACEYVRGVLPTQLPGNLLATSLLNELGPLPKVTLPIPEENLSIRFRLRDVLLTLSAGRPEHTVIPDLLEFYTKQRDYKKVAAYMARAGNQHVQFDQGEMVGKAFLKLAAHFKHVKKSDAYCRALEDLIKYGAYGQDNAIGLNAVDQLMNFYDFSGKREDLKRTICQVIHLFPGVAGERSGDLMLSLAEENIESKHPRLAYRQLRKVVADFPGQDKRHRKKAMALIESLVHKYPNEVTDATGQQERYGPFANIISPALAKLSELKVDGGKSLGNEGFSVELWARTTSEAEQPILHLTGGDAQKLGISAKGQSLLVKLSTATGLKEIIVDADISYWRHLTIAYQPSLGMTIYLEGQRIKNERSLRPTINTVNSVLIGSSPDLPGVPFSGSVQHVVITPGIPRVNDFPKPILPDVRNASVALSGTSVGILEFKGNIVKQTTIK